MRATTKTYLLLMLMAVLLGGVVPEVTAQELNVKININSQQVEGTDKSVFQSLQENLEQWMNDRQWTELQFQKNERINCTFNIVLCPDTGQPTGV